MTNYIHINETNKEFHLTNGKISYIFRVMEQTQTLEQLYAGKAIRHRESFDHLIEREIRPSNNQVAGDHTTSLEHVKQELPVFGTTDFRYPALEIRYPDGDRISQFEYLDYQVIEGKKQLPGMPATFADAEEATTLEIRLHDRYSALILKLSYTIFHRLSALTRHAEISNNGEETYQLERLMSFNLDLPTDDFDFIHLHGAWARETQLERHPLLTGVQHISSTRGASSHVHNPFFALAKKTTTEQQGEVFGFSFVYSGNFLAQVEVDPYHVTRAMIGINPHQFGWELSPGEVFTAPEAVMVYSDAGLNGMSQTFHSLYRSHLISPKWSGRTRPILINNWEATYFDFNEEKIVELATDAQSLGIDLFVLDDGWFGKRDNDASSLGDWSVDHAKLPAGIIGLADKIHNLGLQFGLWFEPEMVSIGTPIHDAHPDWKIGNPHKNISHGRNQYVLDFSRPEVVDNVFNQMDAILKSGKIDYVKWDMNRYISEAFSQALSSERQGEILHRYILGVYALYEKILAKYPELLIESCAGGGGRFDPGLLYYAPQTWASDDTDAVERLKNQYGTSMVYPLSAIGSHVSEVPNHQVARITSLKMRGDVAAFGTFGYELDSTKLTADEKAIIADQIVQVKGWQTLIHQGDFYRLMSPFESNTTAWMVVSADKSEALVGVYHVLAKPNYAYERILLAGLDAAMLYRINGNETARYGDDLMQTGLLLGGNYIGRAQNYWSRKMPGDFSSQLYHLQKIDNS